MSLLARIPLTISHYYDFGKDRERVGDDLVNPASWDAIRETPGPFGLPATREEWERAALTPEFAARADAIAGVAREVGARRICSYGVGAAFLELNLVRAMPEAELVCTDYAPRTVERLARLFPEASVRLHDLYVDGPLAADLHLLHRIDSELGNRAWREVFARLREPALLVATQLLEWPVFESELRRRLSRRPAPTRAGYARTEAAMRSLWRGTHVDRPVPVGELAGFLLIPRQARAR